MEKESEMVRNGLLAAGLVLALAAPALADTYSVDKAHSEAAFQVRHILTKVRGTFRDFSGTINFDKARPENSTVEFRIKAASIDTGNQKRDDHLRSPDFFDVATHPEIVFKSTKVVSKGNNTFDVTGDFTMHGVTKSIVLPVAFLGEQKFGKGVKAGFETAVTLNRKDYGLNWNRALESGGVLVGEEVEIAINIEADLQQPTASN
jgi:polyisoprenoid-binding protein YceI